MQGPLRVRRARRDDFARVLAMLGTAGEPTRAERKRFRRLVTTMREDLYLAERDDDGPLAGLAVIAYLRGLGPRTALVRSLCGDDEARARLLECARAHATARGCTRIEVHADPDGTGAGIPLGNAPWVEGPRAFHATLPTDDRKAP
jgi:hypothetical protein